jgi:hypothetical protein
MAVDKSEKQWFWLLIPAIALIAFLYIAYGLFFATFSRINSEFGAKNSNKEFKK